MDLMTAPQWLVEMFVAYVQSTPALKMGDVNVHYVFLNKDSFNPLFNLFCKIRGFCS